MSRRSEQLKTVATNFIKVHDDWTVDPNRPNPDAIYWDAVDSLFESFEDGDIPGDSRPLAEAIGRFRDEADRFEDRDDVNEQHPHDAFWAGVESIRKLLAGPTRRELPPLESIKELVAMPYMQHAQVAEMYGFKDRRGNLMVSLVQKELDTPGSVLKTPGSVDGRDWVDPRLAELDQEDGAAERHAEAIEKKGRRSRKESAPCPESAKDLWGQGVSATQAAKMLQKPEAEVSKQFSDWTAAAEFAKKVWELTDKGVPIGEICKQMKTDPKRVEAALRERPPVGGEADAA